MRDTTLKNKNFSNPQNKSSSSVDWIVKSPIALLKINFPAETFQGNLEIWKCNLFLEFVFRNELS